MVHYDDQAKKILNAVLAELRKGEKSDGKSIVHAMKLIQDADKIAIECAVKLAPFQSATLKSVEVKSKSEVRYVMRTPEKIKDGQDWLSRTGHKSDEDNTVKLPPVHVPSPLSINDVLEMDEEDDIEDQRDTLRH